MRHTGRVRGFVPVLLGSALAVVLGLSGCGGADQDASSRTLTPLPSASSVPSSAPASTSPSAAPSKAPVVRAGPPPKTPFTRAGAELFVRDYYATASEALRTGDARDLQNYVRAGCECAYQVQLLKRIHRKHEHFSGHGYVLHKVILKRMAGNAAVMRVSFSLRSMPLLDRTGRRVDRLTDVRLQTDELLLRYLSRHWAVERVFFGRPR